MMDKKFIKTKLGDVVSLRKEQVSPAECFGMKFVGLEHLISGQHNVTDFGLINDQRSLKSKFFSGDVLYGKLRPYLDKGGLVSFDGCCSTDILVFVTDKNKTSPEFISQLIHTNEFVSYAMTHINGTNHPRTSWKELAKYEFYLPPLAEQKRIASTLSAVDKAIEQAGIAIEESERMKRGLMQKLIPENIDKMSEWKVSQLSELGKVQTGPFGSQLHNKDYVDNGSPIITVEHLSEYGIVKENLPCVSDSDKERLSKFVLHSGDIVFSRVGSVDRNCIVTDAEDGWLFSGRLLRIRPDSTIVNAKYLSFYFHTQKFKTMINNHSVGGIMPSLNTKLMSEVLVTLPPLGVQEKIVKILECANYRITSCIRRKSLLETLKRGMMQQLLAGGK